MQKALTDFLFGLFFGLGFAIARGVAAIIAQLFAQGAVAPVLALVVLGSIACTEPLDCPSQIQWNAELERCQNIENGQTVKTECCEAMWDAAP